MEDQPLKGESDWSDSPTLPQPRIIVPPAAQSEQQPSGNFAVGRAALLGGMAVLVIVLALSGILLTHRPSSPRIADDTSLSTMTATSTNATPSLTVATSMPGTLAPTPSLVAGVPTATRTSSATQTPLATPTREDPTGMPPQITATSIIPSNVPTNTPTNVPTQLPTPTPLATPINPNAPPVLTEIPISSMGNTLIASGPNGTLWFGDVYDVVRYTIATGTEAVFPNKYNTEQILQGPDGAMWFLAEPYMQGGAAVLARITYDGTYTQMTLTTIVANNDLAYSFCVGPDGNFWMSMSKGIARVTPSGATTLFPFPFTGLEQSRSIVTGPDGALWFTLYNSNRIGRMTTNGTFSFYNIPTSGLNQGPSKIIAGPDHALWFINDKLPILGQVTTNGVVKLYTPTLVPMPKGVQKPEDIIVGPDGYIWYTDIFASGVGRFNTADGTSQEYLDPTNSTTRPLYLANGSDGNVYFTQNAIADLGRVTP